MIHPELPAYLANRGINDVTNFSVVAIDLEYFKFQSYRQQIQEFRLGRKVLALDDDLNVVGQGYISKVEDTGVLEISVRFLGSIINLGEIKFARLSRDWNAVVPSNELLIINVFEDAEDLALLEAHAKVPDEHKAGLISWSLFWNEQEVIRGTDYLSRGICRWEQPLSVWAAGNYELMAQRIDALTGNIVTEDVKTWTLSIPLTTLSCGQYSDPVTALLL